MAANSATVAAGNDGTATQYNNLRLDVLDPTTGHDHSGAADHGKKIPGVWLTNDGLNILDTNASHYLIIKPGSDITADRILTITTGDAARTVTLSGNPTLADWFDQAVKAASSPTFANLNLPNAGKMNFSADGDCYLAEVNNKELNFTGDALHIANSKPMFFSFDSDCSLKEIGNKELTYTGDAFYRSDNSATFNTTSDIRLKENIKPLPSMIDAVMALNPSTFTYKKDGKLGYIEGEKMSFIADDVEKVFPDWVKVAEDGYKNLNLEGLSAVLVKVVQEQQRQIEQLQNN